MLTAQRKDPAATTTLDAGDERFRRDPYPRYAELREADVLHRTPDGFWVLTRHADVLAAVRDQRLSSHPKHQTGPRRDERAEMLPLLGDQGLEIMLLADPPDHTRLRRLANKAFTPRAVEQLRPRVVEIVDELLDAAVSSDGFDVMHDLAEPLPVIVICEMLGVPAEDHEQFKPWSTAIARMLDPDVAQQQLDEAIPAIIGFVQYFNELIDQRRTEPRDDLLSSLIAAEAEGEKLSVPELFAMVILLFIAGHETTTNLIGNGTLALLRHPDQFALLRDDPTLAAAATEELLRYDAPVQLTVRTATEDVDVNGLPLAKGESVICGLAAANRDHREFDDPDRLDLTRPTPHHVSFSNGMHHCLGAPLARLEGQVAFTALTQRFPNLSLAVDQPPYRDHFILRGLAALPVTTT